MYISNLTSKIAKISKCTLCAHFTLVSALPPPLQKKKGNTIRESWIQRHSSSSSFEESFVDVHVRPSLSMRAHLWQLPWNYWTLGCEIPSAPEPVGDFPTLSCTSHILMRLALEIANWITIGQSQICRMWERGEGHVCQLQNVSQETLS